MERFGECVAFLCRIGQEMVRVSGCIMTRKGLRHLLTILGLNAIPAFGWFVADWSSGTTLAVYWFENVAASLFVAARILLHRRCAPLAGHFRYKARKGAGKGSSNSLLSYFLPTSLIFSAGHGFFLGMLIFVLTHNGRGDLMQIDWASLRSACGLTLVFLTVDFLVDLPGMSRRSFAWIEREVDRTLARVIIVHMTIVFGMFGIAVLGINSAMFGVFMVLKTLNDLSAVVPQWNPAEPPAWLCRLMDRIPSAHPGETFAEYWRKDKADEMARLEGNERPVVGLG